MIFCWLLVAIIRDPGAGTLKGLCPYLPPHLSYWALIRMLRSGKWDAQAVMNGMADKVLRALPPAADGTPAGTIVRHQRVASHRRG